MGSSCNGILGANFHMLAHGQRNRSYWPVYKGKGVRAQTVDLSDQINGGTSSLRTALEDKAMNLEGANGIWSQQTPYGGQRTTSIAVSDGHVASRLGIAGPIAWLSDEPLISDCKIQTLGRKGCEIVVEALERHGVTHIFGLPGASTQQIHEIMKKSSVVKSILFRHEQGEIFAASGYAKSSGRVGVCLASSGPGATNLITGLIDAHADSIPIVAITGQLPMRNVGTDAFQDVPFLEMAIHITKHTFRVRRVEDIALVLREAFLLATTGRPGPVLVEIPSNLLGKVAIPDWHKPISPGVLNHLRKTPMVLNESDIEPILDLLLESKRPMVCYGGGCQHASPEIKEFIDLTGIPVVSTMMGLGVFPRSDTRFFGMLGQFGPLYANYAVDQTDLLLAFGVRFSDKATNKLESFAGRAKLVHIDIDPSELGKNKIPTLALCADIKPTLDILNRLIRIQNLRFEFTCWMQELEERRKQWPMILPRDDNETQIAPQNVIRHLWNLTKGRAIITTSSGQHQVWAGEWYKHDFPRHWITSGGVGTMGYGMPAAIGAALANPDKLVIDIDGDGGFQMNIQELATIRTQNLPVKMLILNNHNLGLVTQWDELYYESTRPDVLLGNPDNESDNFPDLRKIAECYQIPSARVTKPADVVPALQLMLQTPGPFLLDVVYTYKDHVLPLVPSNGSFKDTITQDGKTIHELI